LAIPHRETEVLYHEKLKLSTEKQKKENFFFYPQGIHEIEALTFSFFRNIFKKRHISYCQPLH